MENLILVECGKCFFNIVFEVDVLLLEFSCIGVLVFKWGEVDDVLIVCYLVGVFIIIDFWFVLCSFGEWCIESCWLGVGSFVGGVIRYIWEIVDFCCFGGYVVYLGDKMGEFWFGEVLELVIIVLIVFCWVIFFICFFCWIIFFVCFFF